MIARPPQQEATAQREIPLRAGANLRATSNPMGMCIEGPTGGADFRHPFLVTATAAAGRVSSGLILAETGVEPLIGKVPIGGTGTTRQPALKLDPSLVNKAMESWVCVEVTPTEEGKVVGADGKLLDGAVVEVVQRAAPILTIGPTGRAPLALLFYGDGSSLRVTQIAMFHLRYETVQPANQPRRHYFL